MDAHYDPETTWPVDVRTLSPHRGYVMSWLAPVSLHSGTPMAAVYGTTLFDAAKITALLEHVTHVLAHKRGRFDLKRFGAAGRTLQRWRQAHSIDALIADEEFADHLYDRLVEYDRARNRDVQVVNLLGQPSVGLTQVTLAALETLEATSPPWSRMNLECWPAPSKLPPGYVADETFPPRTESDVFVYCYRVYDVDHAADVLPEHFVRAFTDEIVRRASANGIALDELLDNGRVTLFTTAAAAEALARGLMNLREAIGFLKKRVAEKQSRFIAQTLGGKKPVEAGFILEIRKHFCDLAQAEYEFSPEELDEIALQWSIHRGDTRRIAQIIFGLSLQRPRTPETRLDPSVIRYGPLSIPKRELGR